MVSIPEHFLYGIPNTCMESRIAALLRVKIYHKGIEIMEDKTPVFAIYITLLLIIHNNFCKVSVLR